MISQPKFSLGDRVRVSEECYDKSFHGFVGIISMPPEAAVAYSDSPWQGYWRIIDWGNGIRGRMYWLEAAPETPHEYFFSSPAGGEVQESALELITPPGQREKGIIEAAPSARSDGTKLGR